MIFDGEKRLSMVGNMSRWLEFVFDSKTDGNRHQYGYPGTSMDVHGCPWICMFPERLQKPTRRFPKGAMDFHGCPWMSMDMHVPREPGLESPAMGWEIHGKSLENPWTNPGFLETQISAKSQGLKTSWSCFVKF